MRTIFAFFVYLLLASCSPSGISDNTFVGKWSVSSFEITSDNLAVSLVEGATEEAKSSVYTFDDNGKFSLDASLNQEHAQGDWVFDEDTKTLKLVFLYEEGETAEEIYKVSETIENTLDLYQEMGSLGKVEMQLKRE